MRKKSILKKILSPILIPITQLYLKKERVTHFFGLKLIIPIGVFHPSLFFSTKTLWRYLATQQLKNKKILEIGSGSGAISILCAKAGAKVFCCDISQEAVNCTRLNSMNNNEKVEAFYSDLFNGVKENDFDLIVNNPPYYPKFPVKTEDFAWYAGEGYDYFIRLFKEAKNILAQNGTLLLVLSDDCNINLIEKMAKKENFVITHLYVRSTWLEKNYVIAYKHSL